MNKKNSQKSDVQHGGVCSSCEQTSNTCITGSKHQVCPSELQGSWVTTQELSDIKAKSILDEQERLAKKVVLTTVFGADGKYVKTLAQNGFGDVVQFHTGSDGNKGVWLP